MAKGDLHVEKNHDTGRVKVFEECDSGTVYLCGCGHEMTYTTFVQTADVPIDPRLPPLNDRIRR